MNYEIVGSCDTYELVVGQLARYHLDTFLKCSMSLTLYMVSCKYRSSSGTIYVNEVGIDVCQPEFRGLNEISNNDGRYYRCN